VKSITELHGGTVSCSSAGEGQGSTFTICLPRMAGEGEGQRGGGGEDDAARQAQQPQSLSIMVVDDNADAAAMLGMLLESSGHRVSIEHDALRALARSTALRPDVFLLDIGLPEIDGNELARRLRGQPETAQAVIIAVTGYGQEQDRAHSLGAGFDHHLLKPVDFQALSGLLADVSARRARARPG